MKKTIGILIMIAALVFLVWYFFFRSKSGSAPTDKAPGGSGPIPVTPEQTDCKRRKIAGLLKPGETCE